MSFKKEFASNLQWFWRDDSLVEKRTLGNDRAFFGRDLKDARLQLAFSLGWMLSKTSYGENDYYTLVPPPHFDCAQNNWSCVFKCMITDEVEITYPDWYFEDKVLIKGVHK